MCIMIRDIEIVFIREFTCPQILLTHTNTTLFVDHKVKRIFLCLQVSLVPKEIVRRGPAGS